MPTQTEAKPDRRLTNARSDVRIALRDINNAIDAEDGGSLLYHRDQAIGRLEFALTALRAAKG